MFSALYHAHHRHYQDDLSFWLALANQDPTAMNPILELGCGTGRVLLPILQAGHVVVGLDNDYEMLRYLQEQLMPSERVQTRLVQSDMRHFHFATQFRLILLPCNTISILSLEDLKATLACTARHLQPKGIFATSLPNPELLVHLPATSDAELEEVIAHPIDGEPVQISSAWQHDRRTFQVTWYYDHLLPDGQVDRLTVVIQHKLHPVSVYQQALNDFGFSPVQQYGDFDGKPYRKNSPHLILVAQKHSP